MREFIALLSSHEVEYVVVGGHAVAFHGHPRFTGDMDFLVRPTPENARRVLAVLDDFGFGTIGVSEGDLTTPGRVVQLGHPPNRIDILTSISGVDFDAAWASRIETEMAGQRVRMIGWSELLQNKRASGRQQDLVDVAKLLAVARQKRTE
ncbi:MAG TPA: DUF6036 family nucleotidyltransferase [Thermoanaerobaculia bacterium]